MAGCRIVNQNVSNAVDTIKGISDSYRTAGENFVSDLNAAISEMEGNTKDALKAFIDNDINAFVSEQLPGAIAGMSELLEGNRSNFEKTDSDLAASIGGGQG
ncbi:MAG: hypothetical protein LBG81_04580 [Coriobacteriaceae bacterium]|jgi:hypothetical protein|nr:hypothetical protein [Coriobacteriaceae bacterium]